MDVYNNLTTSHHAQPMILHQSGRSLNSTEAHEIQKEKVIKRHIANARERRRTKKLNESFDKLKKLLPIQEDQKVSKKDLLRFTTFYIQQLQRETKMLQSTKKQLGQEIMQYEEHGENDVLQSFLVETNLIDQTESTDLIQMKLELDRERKHREKLEDLVRTLESQIYTIHQ